MTQRRRASWSVVIAVGTAVTLLLPEWNAYSDNRSRVRDARSEVGQIVGARRDFPGLQESFARSLVSKKPRPAVLFVGDSIIRAGLIPTVFKRELGLKEEVTCAQLGRSGRASVTGLHVLS